MTKCGSAHKISQVAPGSIAEEFGIEPGDSLLLVNGQKVEDVFDYRFMIREEVLTIVIRKGKHSPEFLEMGLPDEEPEDWELEIEKDSMEDLGLEFESGLMDEYRSCKNRCIFCFIDQMPPGMRDTLYFHDDDARLSFLQGNYITLTNMSDHDIDRIIRYHLEPINISFHTLDPQLRCRMLHNRFAGEIFQKVRRLRDAGIEMNGQIVLCRGINDKEQLEYSLRGFEEYLPQLKSVSVVPVGLTKYREHLEKLEPFDRESAGQVISQIERWQDYYMEHAGTHLVHASDEWYILAGREFPAEERYDGYLQLENGVGMMRLLIEQVREALRDGMGSIQPGPDRHVTIATGLLAAPTLKQLVSEITAVYPFAHANVIPIRNDFFGELITVSGLITGQDLIRQLQGKDLGERLLIPVNMLRSQEKVFLDDRTVEQIEEALQIKIVIVESDGRSLVAAVCGLSAPDWREKEHNR